MEEFEKEADRIGYPVLIKAILGGGGKVSAFFRFAVSREKY